MKLSIFLAATLFLGGCSTAISNITSSPRMKFHEIRVLNLSASAVVDMSIFVPTTRSIVNCTYVPQSGLCSYKMQPRLYKGEPAEIRWVHQGRQWKHTIGESGLDLSGYDKRSGAAVTIELQLFDAGKMNTQIVYDDETTKRDRM